MKYLIIDTSEEGPFFTNWIPFDVSNPTEWPETVLYIITLADGRYIRKGMKVSASISEDHL